MSKNTVRTKSDNKDILILTMVFLMHVAFLYIISNYSIKPETYRDELIYIGVVKSLVRGETFRVHGVPIPFLNILYPLVLSPAFMITDTVIRMRVVVLINSILISLTFYPAYFICKELGVKKVYTWIIMGILFIWPDMTIAATFMSENLYLPLVVFTAYLCVKSFKSTSFKWPILVGIFSYISYNCKEIGLCLLLSFLGVEVLSGIFSKKDGTKNSELKEWLKNIRYSHIFSAVLTFAVCYLAFKLLVVKNMINPYFDKSASSIEALKQPYTIYFLFYMGIYYLVSSMIAFFILPLVVPAVRFAKLTVLQKKTYLLGMIELIGMIMVIGIMIFTNEYRGDPMPPVHLRYLFPLIFVFLPVFFSFMTMEVNEKDKVKREDYYWWAIISLISVVVFKGLRIINTTGGLSLMYSYKLNERFPRLCGNGSDLVLFYPAAYIVTGLASLIVLAYMRLGNTVKRKTLMYAFSIVAIVLCLVNFISSYKIVKDTYGASKDNVNEMARINEFFMDNDLSNSNVMFVGGGLFTADTKIYDFYFDATDNQYEISQDDLLAVLSNEAYSGTLSDATFILPIWEYEYHTETIDYIIAGDGYNQLDEIYEGLEKVEECSGAEFTVYRNVDNKTLNVK
ncbi:hypothetical protein SAMN04487928_101151 [Butyrivibrio proteoclasticus]|uniref:Dolichyl-phosphate-mannose-protein mannosyltransferase n=1 Tax=Butyrivibrio proteoclasticus TaxID=43305 RepID=A0A1I5PUL4_9FIRM|nr:hypothetical protein [Butyrivibrio proteoclasticus]SFP37725.1 hypothetical protein SAMN04487928_101151 [Butyrivibrio proteoclasticus]